MRKVREKWEIGCEVFSLGNFSHRERPWYTQPWAYPSINNSWNISRTQSNSGEIARFVDHVLMFFFFFFFFYSPLEQPEGRTFARNFQPRHAICGNSGLTRMYTPSPAPLLHPRGQSAFLFAVYRSVDADTRLSANPELIKFTLGAISRSLCAARCPDSGGVQRESSRPSGSQTTGRIRRVRRLMADR